MRTAPVPFNDASAITSKGFVQSGNCNTGVDISADLTALKHFKWTGVHAAANVDLIAALAVSEVRGATRLEYPTMKCLK